MGRGRAVCSRFVNISKLVELHMALLGAPVQIKLLGGLPSERSPFDSSFMVTVLSVPTIVHNVNVLYVIKSQVIVSAHYIT